MSQWCYPVQPHQVRTAIKTPLGRQGLGFSAGGSSLEWASGGGGYLGRANDGDPGVQRRWRPESGDRRRRSPRIERRWHSWNGQATAAHPRPGGDGGCARRGRLRQRWWWPWRSAAAADLGDAHAAAASRGGRAMSAPRRRVPWSGARWRPTSGDDAGLP
jgi:hypothetical protein